jgi:hypothetical protein
LKDIWQERYLKLSILKYNSGIMGETKLHVNVESIFGRNGITSSTDAHYHDSDNDPELKRLASYGCSRIGDYLTQAQIDAFTESISRLKFTSADLLRLKL